jgi:hypothetical protein
MAVLAMRVVLELREHVHEKGELLQHLRHEQGDTAERVRDGRAALARGDAAGHVEVGQERAAGADRRADGDLERALVVHAEELDRPGTREPYRCTR